MNTTVVIAVNAAAVSAALVYIRWKRRRNGDLEARVLSLPVLYETKALVGLRKQRSGWRTYRNGWNAKGWTRGVKLVVRAGAVEVGLGNLGQFPLPGPGDPRRFFESSTAVMWWEADSTFLGAHGRPCIRLLGRDGMGAVDVAVVPDDEIDVVWRHLVQGGIRPTDHPYAG